MAKKLIKYGKFLMSVALIFCLIAPSYASLSNTDGSSFVTKAEFDSALADFNARLTTFEAGINSKIDSQVTSYLDRNGIWSAKEQDLKKVNTEWIGFEGDSATTGRKLYHYRWDTSASQAAGISARYAENNTTNNYLASPHGAPSATGTCSVNDDIVEKCNKNGLCYLVFDSNAYINKQNVDWPSDTTAPVSAVPVRVTFVYDRAWACWDVGFKTLFRWDIVQVNSAGVESDVLSSFTVNYLVTLAGANLKDQSNATYVCLFFCKKDQGLRVKSYFEYEKYDGSNNKCAIVFLDKKATLAHRMHVKECKVY